jgi:hypothetical protein
LYIVTNKHVIYGENFGQNQVVPKPKIDALKLNLHTNPKNFTQNEEKVVSLFAGENKVWLEHSHSYVDVVLVPLTIDRTKFVITALNQTFIDSNNLVVDDFEKIFVFGYPYGWYDRLNNLPVVRVGHLSSPFKIPFQGKQMMIGDVTTHKGMSGGPVLMHLVDYTTKGDNGKTTRHLGSTRRLLAGINSGQFQIKDDAEERVNLISIWFPEIILEILRLNEL